MRWLTSKAKEAREAAQAFHDRALKAEHERDGFRRFFEKYREEAHELTVERDTALAERDEAREARDRFRSERDEAKRQLKAVTGERDIAGEDRRQTESRLKEARADREALRDQLQTLTAERDTTQAELDEAVRDILTVKYIVTSKDYHANYTEENK